MKELYKLMEADIYGNRESEPGQKKYPGGM